MGQPIESIADLRSESLGGLAKPAADERGAIEKAARIAQWAGGES
jgi:hypothetical protein